GEQAGVVQLDALGGVGGGDAGEGEPGRADGGVGDAEADSRGRADGAASVGDAHPRRAGEEAGAGNGDAGGSAEDVQRGDGVVAADVRHDHAHAADRIAADADGDRAAVDGLEAGGCAGVELGGVDADAAANRVAVDADVPQAGDGEIAAARGAVEDDAAVRSGENGAVRVGDARRRVRDRGEATADRGDVRRVDVHGRGDAPRRVDEDAVGARRDRAVVNGHVHQAARREAAVHDQHSASADGDARHFGHGGDAHQDVADARLHAG